MTYIDWEYYNSLHADMDQESFARVEKMAEVKLNTVTHLRAKRFLEEYDANTSTDFQKQVYEQIRSTMCDLVSAMYLQEASGMGTGVTSVSNAGYSESYKVTTSAEKEAQLLSLIRNGLSGTGLAGAL